MTREDIMQEYDRRIDQMCEDIPELSYISKETLVNMVLDIVEQNYMISFGRTPRPPYASQEPPIDNQADA